MHVINKLNSLGIALLTKDGVSRKHGLIAPSGKGICLLEAPSSNLVLKESMIP